MRGLKLSTIQNKLQIDSLPLLTVKSGGTILITIGLIIELNPNFTINQYGNMMMIYSLPELNV